MHDEREDVGRNEYCHFNTTWVYHHPRATPDMLGFIPAWLWMGGL